MAGDWNFLKKEKLSPFYVESFIHGLLISGIMLDSLSSYGRPSTASPVAGNLLLLMVMRSDGLIRSCVDSNSWILCWKFWNLCFFLMFWAMWAQLVETGFFFLFSFLFFANDNILFNGWYWDLGFQVACYGHFFWRRDGGGVWYLNNWRYWFNKVLIRWTIF